MQHKVSDTWKCAYNTEYPVMAEDGLVGTTTMTNAPSPNNNSNSCNTIITNNRNTESSSPPMTNGKMSPDSGDRAVKLEKGLRHSGDLEMGGLGRGRELSGLEQKIQELRAEKEAYELRLSSPEDGKMKIHPDGHGRDEEVEDRENHQSQDTPLDFSVKRRASSFSGSVTDESRASSSSPSHGTADYRGGSLLTVSPSPESVTMMDGGDLTSAEGRPGEDVKGCPQIGPGHGHDIIHQQFHHHLHSNFENHRREATPSPESHSKIKIKMERDPETTGESVGQLKQEIGGQHENGDNQHHHQQQAPLPGLSPPGASSLTPPLLNSLGGLFPGLTPNFLTGKSAMGAFSQMAAAAAFMDPRNVGLNMNNNNSSSNNSNAGNKKSTRPFKAYPKEALQMPLGGFFGAPGLSPSLLQQGIESGMFAGMNTDDLMTLYNQQLQLIREKQVSSSTPTPAQVRKGNSSPSLSPNMTNGAVNNHHENHLQHLSKYRNHQHGPQHSPPHQFANNNHHFMSINPSSKNILTSHHHQNNSSSPPGENTNHHHSSNNYPAPANTLVSSTSPSPSSSSNHNGGSNSRKRPRSLPDEQKDAAYWERRRKNNDAAKRSRDARRAKEDEIALRAALLEQENIKLRVEVASLKTETSRLRCLLYNS